MTKQQFKELLNDQLLFLDGATGSNLQKRGMPSGVCPEKWILENEDIFIGLQKEYIEAGTNVLYAPTFTSNRIKLQEFGLEDQIGEINHKLVALSKKAAGGKAWIAGDLTMTGQQLKPMGTMDFEELVDIYKEQIIYLTEAGVDLLVVETMMSLQESRAALIAAKEVSNLPVMVTMTFEADGRALYGTDVLTAAITLESLGADAFGINCSTGPVQMIPMFEKIHRSVRQPAGYDPPGPGYECKLRGAVPGGDQRGAGESAHHHLHHLHPLRCLPGSPADLPVHPHRTDLPDP